MLSTPAYVAPFAAGGSTPIDPELARRLLTVALSYGGDYADLFFEYEVSGSYALDEQILKAASRSVSMGLGVRVLKGDATGFAYVQELTPEAMAGAARTAGQIAASGAKVAPVAFNAPKLGERYQPKLASFDVAGELKRDMLLRADAAARAADPRVIRVNASLSEELREILIATSDGKLAGDRQPMLRFSVGVICEQNGKRESGSSSGGGRIGLEYFDQKSVEQHAREAVRHALTMLDARESPAGELPVVLSAGESGILLHEAVGHGLEADFNRKGTSNYTNQIGKQVASDLCTVVDDGTLFASRGSINIDDEGNEPGSATLIEKGILVGYMHDQHSAGFFKTRPSGNGRRESFAARPLPRMTNTLLLGGESDPEEILRSVKRGIYASKFGGGQVDISNGDFVFSLTEGYLVEDGKITAPLKGVNLIGNGPEVMRRVELLGKDFALSDGMWTCGKDGQSVPVGVGMPTVLISGLTVGGTKVG